eukprot:CAMPEP_0174282890 /NCGR_PEP_ID=MMETSP0809-20121228/3472_1 /TAXON_ID=73025 ORGANISM="Eutreptiella gymnastica-like, Strain CCMP1594" /NCGR_SAMPLE_ID=MMETSP0809 /ASSEMBLY_ACC=CAM_ASM_000658 /LENGTH=467 /DNA_ID=CAMNT_0015377407 /DNA_START=130 /DNA_END=1533 /DNA_ORIENTATION=-
MVVNVLFQSDDVWTPKDVKETLQKPVEDNIRLRAYPKLSGLWWQWEEVQDFSLDNHIKLHVLSEPTDEALTKFIDDEVSVQLPRDQPLWKFIVIHGTKEKGSRLLLRMHHVIGDGAGIGAWIHSLCEVVPPPGSQNRGDLTNPDAAAKDEPDGPASPTIVVRSKPKRSVLRKIRDVIDFIIVEIMVMCLGLLKILLLTRDSNSPFKGPKKGQKRTASTAGVLDLTVSEVKAVGKAYDKSITVNDVLCTLLAGTFRRFFESCGLHPDEMTLRLTVPMNMRTRPNPIDMANQFSLVFKTLPIHLPSIQERLASFHVRMGLVKLGLEPHLGLIMMMGLAWLPKVVRDRVLEHFTLCSSGVMTNVLASTVHYRFANRDLKDCGFWVPSSGDLGLGISICTYVEKINIGLIVDEGLLPNWDRFLVCMKEEWEDMKAHVPDFRQPHKSPDVPRHPQDMFDPVAMYAGPQTHKR